jgi:CPA2 family monovalent cation:H+ antiporter-2
VLFFVSVGMLFDPTVLVEQPLRVLLVVGIIVVGKSVAAALLVLLMGYPLSTALSVSAALAQIGEFSFILVGLGLALELLPRQGQSLVLAGALISIALNPLVFSAIEPLRAWLGKRSQLARRLEKRDDPLAELPMSTDRRYLANQVVIVGYGRVGRQVGEALREQGVPFVVADGNRELVERLRAQGQAAVFGDAAEPETLVQAHIVDARMLVIATPQTIQVRQMVETARTLNPDIAVLVRSHNEIEAGLLAQDSGAQVFVGERELARAMAQDVLRRMHAQ